MLCIHNVGMETAGLHGLILCGSEGSLSELRYVHIVDIETFHLHGLILCVFEDLMEKKIAFYKVDIKISDFLELSLFVSLKSDDCWAPYPSSNN